MKKGPALLSLALACAALAAPAEAELIIGLTAGDQLLTFDSATPGSVTAPTSVTGLVGGTLIGIDVRPSDGQLVGVGNLGGIGTVYLINPTTGVATPINTGFVLTGVGFGIDFDPVLDELRIVSLSGQNLRILNGGAGAVIVDTPLNPGVPSVVDAAYSNNFAGTTSTTLYDIDNQGPVVGLVLVRQGSLGGTPISPNSGLLFPIGPLGIITGDPSSHPFGFDISGLTGSAFAASSFNFYTVNLSNGAAILVGQIGPGNLQMLDIAAGVSPAQNVPEPGSIALLALGIASMLGYQCQRRKVAYRATSLTRDASGVS